MTLTLESLDARVRALEAKVFPQAPAIPFKFGFVAHADQLDLVKAFPATRARVSFWPGGAASMESVFGQGIEILPSIKREAKDGKPAMGPLEGAEIDAEKAKHRTDIKVFNRHGIKIIELGNEIDIPRYWSGTVEQFGNEYARHIAPLYHSAGISIIWSGPQVSAAKWTVYVESLALSGQIYPNDRFSIHPYRDTTVAHFDFLDKSVEAAKNALPGKISLNRFDITECGLQRGGSPEARNAELDKMLSEYVRRQFTGSLYGYRIMETERAESVLSPFDKYREETIYAPTWRKYAA